MENDKIFRTKTGFCHVLPDKIVLSRDGVVGNLSNVVVGNSISRIFIVYCALTAAFFYFAYTSYMSGETVEPFVFGVLGLYLISSILRSLNNSAAPVIERSKIRKVIFRKAIPGLTRSRFEVMFEDQDKKIKKRMIMLPGSMDNGTAETEKALKIMKDEMLMAD